MSIRHIAKTTDIHATRVYRIVLDDLGLKKVSAHWVPRMLTDEQKQNRVDVWTDLLCRLQAQPQIFLDRIVTQDGVTKITFRLLELSVANSSAVLFLL